MLYKTVDYFASGSSWEWTKFQQFLPEEVINSIAAIMPPDEEQGEDEIYWGLSSSGTFSIKSAYNDMGVSQTQQRASLWRNVWSWYGPQRIKVFFWLLLNNGVMVNEELAKRRISSTEFCNMCGGDSESSLHMLRDCLDAKRTWEGILRYGGDDDFFDSSLTLTDWLGRNISSNRLMGSGLKWCSLFGIGCWYIWKKRCGFIFKGVRVSPEGIIAQIFNSAKGVEEARFMEGVGMRVNRVPTLVGWRPPLMDTIKLNTDASLEESSNHAFGGGLFRDALGNWKAGFVANIGSCSILAAEIWCIFYGLKLAKELGYQKLEVESDSLVGVSMIMGRNEVSINCRAIVQKVCGLLQEFDAVTIHHVHREGNFSADFLSHFAYSFQRGVHVLETQPLGLSSWLLHDRLGISYPR